MADNAGIGDGLHYRATLDEYNYVSVVQNHDSPNKVWHHGVIQRKINSTN